MRKIALFVIFLFMLIALAGCGQSRTPAGSVPEDFSFSLTWGCYGISSYHSETGELIKTTDATNPSDYVTYYTLSAEEKSKIYAMISSLNLYSYPDAYNPNEGVFSEPSMTLVLTIHMNGTEKTVRAENIATSFTSKNKKGRSFLTTCKNISEMLTETKEWKALPDYEHLYA